MHMRRVLVIRKRCNHPRAKQSKCADSYYVFYGRDHRFSVDTQAGEHIATYSEAEKLAKDWARQIDDKVFVKRAETAVPVAATKSTFTLADFALVYLRDCSMLNQAGKELKDKKHPDHYVFQPLLAFELPDKRVLGELPFAAIDEKMYELYVADRREQGYAASTVNKDVQLITAMCRWATRRKYFGPYGENPISGESRVIVRKDPARRHRPVTDLELQALKPHTDATLWAFIQIALITCLRLTELYRLKWSDYRGMKIKVRIEATKSGERWAPLNDHGVAILDYLRIDPKGEKYPDGDYIFGQCGEPPVEINDRFNTAQLKAFPELGEDGQPIRYDWVKGVHGPAARARLDAIDLLFGDIRHEGALRKYREGWLLNELQMLLGHTNLVQTSTYLGVGNEEVMRAMERHGAGAKVLEGDDPTTPNYHKLPQKAEKPVLQ
jgi:integrase